MRRSRGHLRRDLRRSQDGVRMSVYFEELDFRPTPMGVLSLRRRRQLSSSLDVFETIWAVPPPAWT